MTTKNNKLFIAGFVLPCILVLLVVYAYPLCRTIIMSFFHAGDLSTPVANWTWVGIDNYVYLVKSKDFLTSFVNVFKLLIMGGVITLVIAIILGVVLSNKAKLPGRNAFRTIIYLPNMLSAIAIGNAFTYYVFQEEFGLLVSIERWFKHKLMHMDLEAIETFAWMTSGNKFYSMMFAIVFCGAGYYMLLMITGLESVPDDLYEAAVLDGAGPFAKFFHVTLPLLKGTFKNMITFWTILTMGMFAWPAAFSPLDPESSTIVPAIYLQGVTFGSIGDQGANAGLGAAVGIITSVVVQIVYTIAQNLLKADDLEF